MSESNSEKRKKHYSDEGQLSAIAVHEMVKIHAERFGVSSAAACVITLTMEVFRMYEHKECKDKGSCKHRETGEETHEE